jgi:hypothetical protein
VKGARFVIVPPEGGKPLRWTIKVTFSDGKRRRITGIKSEAIAAEWVATASAAYLRNLRKPWNPLRRREKAYPGNRQVAKRKIPPKGGPMLGTNFQCWAALILRARCGQQVSRV